MRHPIQCTMVLMASLGFWAGCTSTQTKAQPYETKTKTNTTPNTAKRAMIHVDALQPGQVIGRLGEPLGKVVTIEAEIIDGDTLKQKAMMGLWLLHIKRVGDQRKDALMSVEGVVLPKTHGAPIKLIGYETGRFIGTPSEAFKHIPAMATRGFGFETSFVALKKP